MKKLVVSAIAIAASFAANSAIAADLPARAVYKAPPPVAAVWTWTGFYVGVHVGAGWGTKEVTLTNTPPPLLFINENNYAINGFLGGGQVGVNYQFGQWVVGAEAQFSWADLDGKGTCNVILIALNNCHTKADFIGTIAARLGFAVDRALVYVKGGGAWVHDKYDISFAVTPFTNVHVEDTRWGWMFGTGVEYAFTGNWSAKVEYNFMDFGTKTYLFPGIIGNDFVDIRERIHLVKFGLNYRFGGFGLFPVSAAY